MLERFTIDIIAEEVATRLVSGDPTAKLSHRFFRKGRRDGKKDLAPDGVARLLQEAVALAGSGLAEDYVARRERIGVRIAELDAVMTLGSSDIEVPEHGAAEIWPGGGGPEAVTVGADTSTSARLQVALVARRRLSTANERKRKALEAERATVETARLRTELEELTAVFAQQFESAEHAGQMLWARFCNGFSQGLRHRGSRGAKTKLPQQPLSFDPPQALASSARRRDGVAQNERDVI
jgi:hypothetical protein